MIDKIKILAFSGSLRSESFNHKLLLVASEGAREAGAEVTIASLREFPMPLLNQDDEKAYGLPSEAKRFKELLKKHHGLLIASPEYNSSVSAALKNAIDWASRKEDGERELEAFAGKVAALLSASPGALGGMRGLVQLRSILGNIQTLVLPEQYSLSNAAQAFNAEGSLVDPKAASKAKTIGKRLVEVTSKLVG